MADDIPLQQVVALPQSSEEGGRSASGDSLREGAGALEAEATGLERTLGLWSGMAIVMGTIIGSGVFSTPSLILEAVGSVGMSMAVWVVGAAVSICGCVVYMELGTMLPRSGGEKEYLDTAFPRPRALMPFLFCLANIFIGSSSGLAADAMVTGTYFLYAATGRPSDHSEWAQRLIGVCVAVFCMLMHGFFVRAAIRVQNGLTIAKVAVLLLTAAVGAVVGFRPGHGLPAHMWSGTSTHPSAYVSALFKVFFAYSGYTALNYSIDELRDPVRNLPRAAVGGLAATAVLYVLSNLAYFMVLDPRTVLESGTAVAGVFYTEAFGDLWGQRIVPVMIGLAALGNVMCGMFSASRVIFEAAREGYLPGGRILGEISKFQSPLAALAANCVLISIYVVVPPAGEAYGFLIDIGGYPLWLFYGLATIGLLVMRYTHASLPRPFRAWMLASIVTLACAIFMCVVPFIKPDGPPTIIPYWAAPVAAVSFIVVSCGLWYVQIVIRRGIEMSGYTEAAFK